MLLGRIGQNSGRRAWLQLGPSCSRWSHSSSNSQFEEPTPVGEDCPNKNTAEQQPEFEDRKGIFTAINVITGAKSRVRLDYTQGDIRRFKRNYSLPPLAVDGLRNAVLDSELPAKVLQHDADQLLERLDNRRFPAPPDEVRAVRNQIKAQLREEEPSADIELGPGRIADKVKQAQEYELKHKVDKAMKKTHYNWKPINFSNQQDALAYALCRLAPNYAEVSRVLEEFNRLPEFIPKSILDYGSGVGGAFWASYQRWDNRVKSYTSVDVSDWMTKLSMDIMRSNPDTARIESSPLLHKAAIFRRNLVPSLQTTYDMVIVHRTLCELGSRQSRLELIESLWQRTNRFLIIIDSALGDSFRAVLECRDFLLSEGVRFSDTIREFLQENDAMTPLIESLLNDRNITDFERYALITEQVPHLKLPTALDPATVFAPCPHDLGCPFAEKDSLNCTFEVAYRPSRADCKKHPRERGDGCMSTRFSFVIMEKGRRKPGQPEISRLLENRQCTRHNVCDMCTAYRGVQRLSVAKSDGALYKMIRARKHGEPLPLAVRTLQTDDELQLQLDDEQM